jgi:hypothetical protein
MSNVDYSAKNVDLEIQKLQVEQSKITAGSEKIIIERQVERKKLKKDRHGDIVTVLTQIIKAMTIIIPAIFGIYKLTKSK